MTQLPTQTAMTIIAQQTDRLALDVDDSKATLTLEQLTTLMDWCDSLRKTLSVISREALLAAADKFPRDGKQITWRNEMNEPFVTELKYSSVRTAVQRDELYKAVELIAMDVENRYDHNGEILSFEEAMLTMVKSAFRFEPRWTEIQALGLDPDQFCTTKREPKITTTKVNDTGTGEAF